MSRDGSGNYSLPALNPVVNGTAISSTWANNTLTDVAAALTASIAKDGQTTPSADLPMGTQKHLNVGDSTARNQYGATGQIQDNDFNVLGSVSGTNTIVGSLTPALTSYSAGMHVTFVPANTNTGAATIAINGLTALDVQKHGGSALVAGDLIAGIPAVLVLDGGSDDWILLNPLTLSGTGLTLSGNATIGGSLQVAGGFNVIGSVAGTNTITGSMSPAPAAYSAGMLVIVTPANNNTGATTLNLNSLGALDVQKADGDALVSGDLVAGIPALLMLDSGADDWILLNPQTGNFTGLNVTGAVTFNGALTTDNTTADEVGFKGTPQNPQNGNYTLVLSDAGKQINYQGAGGHTHTVPPNSSVAFPLGTVITWVADSSGTLTIAQGAGVTIYLAGTSSTGNKTLAIGGVCTLIKSRTDVWYASGTGLS